jgi:intracellular septation protein
MNQLLELSPLLAFFVAFKLGNIYWATGVLMAACVLVLLVHRLRYGVFRDMHVITAVVVLVLGTATLLLHDKRFIQWKPTVIFALLSIALLVNAALKSRPLIQRLFEAALATNLTVTAAQWRVLNLTWAVWFAFLAALNLYIARAFSENVWVNFHVYGITVASVLFMLPQAFWLNSKTPAESPPPETG